MKVVELNSYLTELIPPKLQESYDNSGEQILFHEDEIRRVHVSLDIDNEVIDNAISSNCNVIVTHHPFLFRSLKSIDTSGPKGEQLVKLIENRISVYSMHTNLDQVLSCYLSDFLGYAGGDVLIETGELNGEKIGYGSFVQLNEVSTLGDVLKNLLQKLETDFLTYCGDLDMPVSKLAFLNGSGGSHIENLIDSHRPHCIITGDVGYHNIKAAIDAEVAVIDSGHFASEVIFKNEIAKLISNYFQSRGESIEVVVSNIEKNPFKVYRS